MGLIDKICDSCEQETDVLFQVAILDETPTGEQMVKRWYCIKCEESIREEADETETDDLPKKTREYKCGCRFETVSEDYYVWKAAFLCANHHFDPNKDVTYNCGCIVREAVKDYYVYLEVCVNHEQEK